MKPSEICLVKLICLFLKVLSRRSYVCNIYFEKRVFVLGLSSFRAFTNILTILNQTRFFNNIHNSFFFNFSFVVVVVLFMSKDKTCTKPV
jgi:hypothetical protein